MKFLIAIASLVGSLVILGTIAVSTSEPDHYYDEVEASFSPDLKRAFWHNRRTERLEVHDLIGGNSITESGIDLHKVRWANDSKSLLATLVEDRYRFVTIDPDSLELSKGPFATAFAETPDPNKILLFGRGRYMDKIGDMEAHYHLVDPPTASPTKDKVVFAGSEWPEDGGYTTPEISADGSLLALSKWGYNDSDWFEVRQLQEEFLDTVIVTSYVASSVHFLPSTGKPQKLLVIESSSALVSGRIYSLANRHPNPDYGLDEFSGRVEASALSPDGKILAMAIRRSGDKAGIELYSTADLTLQRQLPYPDQRGVLDLTYLPDGSQLKVLGRAGSAWQLDLSSGEISTQATLHPPVSDTRWVPVFIGLGLLIALWVGILTWHKKSPAPPAGESEPPLFSPMPVWVLGACFVESALLFLSLSSLISIEAVILSLANLVAAGALVLFLSSALLLSIPTNRLAGILTTLIVCISAMSGFYIVVAVISSV